MRIAPHTFFFLLLTILYGIPCILTLFFEINDGYSYVNENILSQYRIVRWKVLNVYIIAVLSYVLGSYFTSYTLNNTRIKFKRKRKLYNILSKSQKLFLYSFVFLGILMLLKMVKAGTFSASTSSWANQRS